MHLSTIIIGDAARSCLGNGFEAALRNELNCTHPRGLPINLGTSPANH